MSGIVISPFNFLSALTLTSLGTAGVSTTNNTTVTMTTGADIALGNTVVVGIVSGDGVTVSSVSDGTNTYTKLTSSNDSNSTTNIEIWHKLSASAVSSGATITVTFSGNNTAKSVAGVIANRTLAVVGSAANAATGTSATPSVASGASVPLAALVMGVSGNKGTQTYTTVGGIWTTEQNVAVGAPIRIVERGITTGAGTVTFNPVLNGSKEWNAIIGAYA